MFSGQGSQYYEMGKQLYENDADFAFWLDHCARIARPHIEASLIDVLYRTEAKGKPFDSIVFSNAALLCIQYCLCQIVQRRGCRPQILLGYSLGEIVAGVVAGAMTLEEGLLLSVEIGRRAERDTPEVDMLAIVDTGQKLSKDPELFADCWVTARNFPGGFVVAGHREQIEQLMPSVSVDGVVCQRLPVRYGFHTELIDPIAPAYKALIRRIDLRPYTLPVISAQRTDDVNMANEDYLWDVIRYPVEFANTVQRLLSSSDYTFIDLGPSATLAAMVKYNLAPESASTVHATLNPFGQDLDAMTRLMTELTPVMAG